ncbi:MAG: acyl-CoA dehydrogenase family protein, partial [Pseudomonadales bacterium]
MNFNLTEEQNMLKDSIARFVADDYDIDARQQNAGSEQGFNRDVWSKFAELGWLSVPFAEEFGGFGGSAVDSMVVMEEFGKGLVVEPYLSTVLLFGGLLSNSGNRALQDTLIEKIIGGEMLGAFAYHERQSRFELHDVQTVAKKTADGFTLSGEKTVVFNGAIADKIIVSARTSGARLDSHGISLFLVDANVEGSEKTAYRMMDGRLVANINLTDVAVVADQLLGELDKGLDLMQQVVNDATVTLSAEALGIMQKLNATTVEYTKTREQFGVPIGSFQALQHRMVDMFTACEQTRSLLYRAVCSIDADAAEQGNDEVLKNIHALKVMVGRAGKLIGGEAIQLHGGMGMTDELNVGHYVKRLMMINTTFGDADYHL